MTGLVRAMRAHAEQLRGRGRGRGHLRHRRRPERDDQRLDAQCARGRRRRSGGLQARRAGGIVSRGLGRRARGPRGRRSTSVPTGCGGASTRRGSASALRRASIRRCGSRRLSAGSSASRPCSTSSARSSIRPGRRASSSASPTRPWPTRCWQVLETFGAVHAMVVFGHDGLDELSTVAPSTLIESVREPDGTFRRRRLEIEPASFGLEPCRAA